MVYLGFIFYVTKPCSFNRRAFISTVLIRRQTQKLLCITRPNVFVLVLIHLCVFVQDDAREQEDTGPEKQPAKEPNEEENYEEEEEPEEEANHRAEM